MADGGAMNEDVEEQRRELSEEARQAWAEYQRLLSTEPLPPDGSSPLVQLERLKDAQDNLERAEEARRQFDAEFPPGA
jgi:hypothetical protein